jgi:hypothetical protein
MAITICIIAIDVGSLVKRVASQTSEYHNPGCVVYCSFESNSHKEALAVAIWNVPISSRHIGWRSVRTTFTTSNVRKKTWNASVVRTGYDCAIFAIRTLLTCSLRAFIQDRQPRLLNSEVRRKARSDN